MSAEDADGEGGVSTQNVFLSLPFGRQQATVLMLSKVLAVTAVT